MTFNARVVQKHNNIDLDAVSFKIQDLLDGKGKTFDDLLGTLRSEFPFLSKHDLHRALVRVSFDIDQDLRYFPI